MPRIRIPKEHWGEVWMTLVEVGAISRISVEPVYLVSKKHIDVLKAKNLPFELVNSRQEIGGGIIAAESETV
ncbi:MAG: hypothetical protein ACE5PV_06175 [Candidatus Poribacteria bacterium]